MNFKDLYMPSYFRSVCFKMSFVTISRESQFKIPSGDKPNYVFKRVEQLNTVVITTSEYKNSSVHVQNINHIIQQHKLASLYMCRVLFRFKAWLSGSEYIANK